MTSTKVTTVHTHEQKFAFFYYLFLLLAVALIVSAARGDLWLDEIWSITFAEHANNPWEIFTRFKHDNNHVLNSLYIYIIGQQNNFIGYRLLSIISGGLSVLLLGMIAKRWGNFEALAILIISGTSYPLVLYFSEARGYAAAIFFSLLSFTALKTTFESIKIGKFLLYWMSVMLGFLAHSTFLIVFVALFCHSIMHEIRTESPLKTKIYRMFSYNFIPSVFFISFYLTFIGKVSIGGGPIYDKWTVVSRAVTLSLGFPEGAPYTYFAVGLACVVIVVGTFLLYKDKQEEWLFYAVVLLAAPVMLIVVAKPVYLYFRYFIICFPFFYLLLCSLLGKCYRSWSAKYQWVVVVMILLFVVGQSFRLIPLLRFGRGSYMDALSYISANTTAEVLKIGSDHDFRNSMLLNFYARFLPENKNIKYIKQSNWHLDTPTWILSHSQNLSYRPPSKFTIWQAGNYKLINSYTFSGISGWSWYLYRNENER